jgi:hypothetical protein
MKCVYYFLLSVIVQGCVTTQSDKTNKLLGEWRGEQAGNTVSLSFSEDIVTVNYSWSDTTSRLVWRYRIEGQDTLKLFNTPQGEEFHIISILTNEQLKLRPMENNQVNIPLIDAITFKKLD